MAGLSQNKVPIEDLPGLFDKVQSNSTPVLQTITPSQRRNGQENKGLPVQDLQSSQLSEMSFSEKYQMLMLSDNVTPAPTTDRYVILPGHVYARSDDIFVESLPNGQGRHLGGCMVMSLASLLKRYDALDFHYYRVKEENARLRSLLSEAYIEMMKTKKIPGKEKTEQATTSS